MSSIVAQPIIENTATPINNNITASPSSAPSSTPSSTTPSLSSSSISATQPYASASLYVGDLNIDVTEALLFEIFNAVGPVASVRVCRDAATRRSLGYAYVNFHRLEDAERALDTLNFKMIRNRACRIMWSHRDPALRRSGLGNIFVNHLARDIDNKQLYDTFSMFGNILSCKVSVNAKRESLGYGFVHYETDESALSAIEKVDGKVINGEKISVQKFQSKKERPSAGAKNKYTNIFVKNLPLDITAEKFQELFSQYGNITSKSINIPTDRTDEKARAFGFLNYETSEQAAAAVEGGNNIELSGKKLFVGRAQKKEERQKELSEKFENLKLERAKKYAGVNLFVKNLNDDVTDEKLTLEFSKFGQISSCTIMKDAATSKSRGFGFVCYTLPEEATRAVTEMHGKMYEGKPLYVALAQRKDQRRAQLEAQYAARQKLGGGQMNQMQGMGMGMQGQMAMNPMYGQQMPLMFPQQQMLQQQQRSNFGINGYPQQLLGANGGGVRWSPQQQQMMGMGMVGGQQIQRGPQQQMNYQLMPANNNMNGQQRGGPNIMNAARGGPRGSNIMNNQNQRNQNAPQQMLGVNGGGMRQQGPPMQQQINKGMMNGQQQQLQQQQQVRYNENVRNQQLSQQQIQQQQQQQRQINSASDPLTPSALASAPEEMRKQMIGERLFPLVRNSEPNLAGKITGMLLEMDNGELLHLLESREALNEKIQEALTVLQQNPPDDEEQQ